jgi:hypothetical protein
MELCVFKIVTRTQPTGTQDIHLLIFCNKYGNVRLSPGKHISQLFVPRVILLINTPGVIVSLWGNAGSCSYRARRTVPCSSQLSLQSFCVNDPIVQWPVHLRNSSLLCDPLSVVCLSHFRTELRTEITKFHLLRYAIITSGIWVSHL